MINLEKTLLAIGVICCILAVVLAIIGLTGCRKLQSESNDLTINMYGKENIVPIISKDNSKSEEIKRSK